MGAFSAGVPREHTQAFEQCITRAQTQTDMQCEHIFPVGFHSVIWREDKGQMLIVHPVIASGFQNLVETRGEEEEVALRKQGGVMLSQ